MVILKKYKIGFICGFVLSVFVIGRIIIVNNQYPQVMYKDVKMGTESSWNELQLKINDVYVLDSKDAVKDYGESILAEMNEDIDFKLISVNASVENNKNNIKTAYLYNLYFENSVYANGIAAEVQLLTDTNQLDIDLKPGESREIELCYIIYENQFRAKEWSKFDIRNYYIVGEYYPVKTRWRFI